MTVTLRPTTDADLPTLYAHQADPVAAERAVWTPRDEPAFYAHWHKILATPDCRLRTVEVDGAVAGNICSWTNHGRRDVGYWLGREFWGRGVATEALRLFLADEPHRPLYADPHVTNTASAALLRRCGFTEAGTDGDYLVFVLEA